MRNAMIRFFSFDKRLYFLILCVAGILIAFLNQRLMFNERVYWNSFGNQLTLMRIQQLMAEQRRWLWLIYLLIPIAYLLKLVAVSFCLTVGSILYEMMVPFRHLFRITLIAEAIFLIPAMIRIYWFSNVSTEYGLMEVKNCTSLI